MNKTFTDLLLSTKTEGIEGLIENLESGGFFKAPCSSKFHLAKEGGLVEHSLNVFKTLVKLNEAMEAGLEYSDMVIVALLHDVGKMGDYGKPNYVENMLKTGVSKAQPYKTNPNLIYEEHEIRSLLIASRYINLTEAQATAILHHNGLFGKLDAAYGNHNHDSSKLAYLLHVADMYCSRFIEVEGDEE